MLQRLWKTMKPFVVGDGLTEEPEPLMSFKSGRFGIRLVCEVSAELYVLDPDAQSLIVLNESDLRDLSVVLDECHDFIKEQYLG